MVDERLGDAAHELYGLDPSQFTARRQALAAEARAAGAGDVAKQIAALRRPTRSAWVINGLSRAHPQLAGEFAALGQRLRGAHLALDGPQIQQLSRQRRQLIDQTAARAFAVAGIDAPSAALRDEVSATLAAVLADPDVAQRFTDGVLITAEEQSGFGPEGPRLVSVPAPRETAPAVTASRPGATSNPPSNPPSNPRSDPKPDPQSARASARERRRAVAIVAAEAELAAAEQGKRAAELAGRQAADAVRQLSERLADARRHEDDTLLEVRRAQNRLAKAQQALRRLGAG